MSAPKPTDYTYETAWSDTKELAEAEAKRLVSWLLDDMKKRGEQPPQPSPRKQA
jgi:hypothetical protein